MSAHAINLGEIELNTNSKVCLEVWRERRGEGNGYPFPILSSKHIVNVYHAKWLIC